jgi:Ca2+-binding RTX toxin-like protein
VIRGGAAADVIHGGDGNDEIDAGNGANRVYGDNGNDKIFRALGWYLLVPLMLAGFICLWKEPDKKNRRVLVLFYLLIIIWTILSSARAGGDQWDNPRYRSIFLVWMAFTGAWGLVQTIKTRSFWLWRLLLLEIIYMGFFIHWYLSRYYDMFKRLDFWPMVRLLLIIGAVIIFGGIIFDILLTRSKTEAQ